MASTAAARASRASPCARSRTRRSTPYLRYISTISPHISPISRQGELRAAFLQLSRDLSTLRWSWRDYILIDDLAEISILNPEARTHTVLVLAHGPLWRRRRLQVAFHALTLTQP